MALNGECMQAGEHLVLPTKESKQSLRVASENIYIPCSKSVMRLPVTGKEANNAFAVVGTGGTAAAPIGFVFTEKLMMSF
jgi:hypothetical protein